MLLELLAGIYLQFEHFRADIHWLIYIATLFLTMIWVITIFVASPLHGKLLNKGYEVHNIKKLINCNWIRTIAWTGRTCIFFYLLLLE